jgi:DNA-binding NarL/FixJ family response regulator
MTEQKKIIIIEDHPLFREGIKTILNRNPHYQIVAEAGTGRDGLRMVRELRPELVLLDLSLPDIRGLSLIDDIKEISRKTGILIISMHSQIDHIIKSFQCGAMGYIVKESAADTLLVAIETVLKGDYYMDSSVSRKVVRKLAKIPDRSPATERSGYAVLTPREQEVLSLLAEGQTSAQVAEKLCISQKTTDNHRTNIMRKLGLQNTVELVRYAAKIGLIDVDRWK